VTAYLSHPSSMQDGTTSPPNLVVIHSTLLELYSVRQQYDSSGTLTEAKLHLLARQRLFGVVESAAVLKGVQGAVGGDALLLTFRCEAAVGGGGGGEGGSWMKAVGDQLFSTPALLQKHMAELKLSVQAADCSAQMCCPSQGSRHSRSQAERGCAF
jgi:hypothetical protein